MIPNHILNDLGPDDRVAVLDRGGKLHFRVHGVADSTAAVRAAASRDGFEVVATHLRDQAALLDLVAGRERDLGGEG
jgi:hypothetical protein